MGDLGKVRELIEDGQVSQNDVDEDGWTPLHVSGFFRTKLLMTDINLQSSTLLHVITLQFVIYS